MSRADNGSSYVIGEHGSTDYSAAGGYPAPHSATSTAATGAISGMVDEMSTLLQQTTDRRRRLKELEERQQKLEQLCAQAVREQAFDSSRSRSPPAAPAAAAASPPPPQQQFYRSSALLSPASGVGPTSSSAGIHPESNSIQFVQTKISVPHAKKDPPASSSSSSAAPTTAAASKTSAAPLSSAAAAAAPSPREQTLAKELQRSQEAEKHLEQMLRSAHGDLAQGLEREAKLRSKVEGLARSVVKLLKERNEMEEEVEALRNGGGGGEDGQPLNHSATAPSAAAASSRKNDGSRDASPHRSKGRHNGAAASSSPSDEIKRLEGAVRLQQAQLEALQERLAQYVGLGLPHVTGSVGSRAIDPQQARAAQNGNNADAVEDRLISLRAEVDDLRRRESTALLQLRQSAALQRETQQKFEQSEKKAHRLTEELRECIAFAQQLDERLQLSQQEVAHAKMALNAATGGGGVDAQAGGGDPWKQQANGNFNYSSNRFATPDVPLALRKELASLQGLVATISKHQEEERRDFELRLSHAQLTASRNKERAEECERLVESLQRELFTAQQAAATADNVADEHRSALMRVRESAGLVSDVFGTTRTDAEHAFAVAVDERSRNFAKQAMNDFQLVARLLAGLRSLEVGAPLSSSAVPSSAATAVGAVDPHDELLLHRQPPPHYPPLHYQPSGGAATTAPPMQQRMPLPPMPSASPMYSGAAPVGRSVSGGGALPSSSGSGAGVKMVAPSPSPQNPMSAQQRFVLPPFHH